VCYTASEGADSVYFIVIHDGEWSSLHLCSQNGTVQPPQHMADEGEEDDETQEEDA
jgi:hypothetical protein